MVLPFQGPPPGMMPPPGMAPPMPMGGPPMSGAPPMGGPPMGAPPMMPPGPPPGLPMGGPPPGMGMGAAMPPMPPPGTPGMGGPPGMGMPGMGVGPPPDPLMMILADPALLKDLLGPKKIEKYREKWQEPTKPTDGYMRSKIAADQTRLTDLNTRFADNLSRIGMESVGVFDDYDEDAETTFRSSAIADQDQLIAAMVGTIDPQWRSPRRRPKDADESQAKEDFLDYLYEQHKRQHQRQWGTDLGIERVKTVTRYGRLATRSVCNFSGRPGAPPLKMFAVDPAVVYPTFHGERGLVEVTLSYQARVADVVGDHDDEDNTLSKALLKGHAKNAADHDGRYDWDDWVTVDEYHDCKWSALYVAGKLVKGPVAHEYGEPPFVYTIAPFGDPAYTRTPNRMRDASLGTGSVSVSESADVARRGLSYFHTQFWTHAQREAMLGRAATMFKRWGNEPLMIGQDDTVYGQAPEISQAEGARSLYRSEHEQPGPMPTAPLPATFGPLMQAVAEDAARGGLPPQEYGITPSAQQSGFSIAGLSERGQNKYRPVVRTVEMHLEACGEQWLRMYMENGDLIGEQGKKGYLHVPRVSAYSPIQDPDWKVTPQMIAEAGWQVEVTLRDTPAAAELGTLANALGLIQKMGAITRTDIISLLGLPGSKDPQQTKREIDIEALKDMPEYKLADLLRYIWREENDPALADFVMAQWIKGKQKDAQQMLGPGPGMGPPGGGPSPVQVQGQSLPGMGMPPGTQGGRPPQGPPPGGMPQGGGYTGPPVEP